MHAQARSCPCTPADSQVRANFSTSADSTFVTIDVEKRRRFVQPDVARDGVPPDVTCVSAHSSALPRSVCCVALSIFPVSYRAQVRSNSKIALPNHLVLADRRTEMLASGSSTFSCWLCAHVPRLASDYKLGVRDRIYLNARPLIGYSKCSLRWKIQARSSGSARAPRLCATWR